MLRKPEAFSHQAPQPISRHGVASGFNCHGKPDASMREPIGLDAKSEEPVVNASPTGIDRIELQLAAQAQFCAKT
jgi:hypothetical protein